MSNTVNEQNIPTNAESSDVVDEVETDLEALKLHDTTFDTAEESYDADDADNNEAGDDNEDDDDEAFQLDAKGAAVDILDQLVELFIERNGREPNEEEVLQWIDVFKSLKVEDVDEEGAEEPSAEVEETPVAPTAE